jgi:hypothetical protein
LGHKAIGGSRDHSRAYLVQTVERLVDIVDDQLQAV